MYLFNYTYKKPIYKFLFLSFQKKLVFTEGQIPDNINSISDNVFAYVEFPYSFHTSAVFHQEISKIYREILPNGGRHYIIIFVDTAYYGYR